MRRVRDEQLNALMALTFAGLGVVGLYMTVQLAQQSFEPGLNRTIVLWPGIAIVLAFDLPLVVRAWRSGVYLEPGQRLIYRGLLMDRTIPLTGTVSFYAVYVATPGSIPPGFYLPVIHYLDPSGPATLKLWWMTPFTELGVDRLLKQLNALLVPEPPHAPILRSPRVVVHSWIQIIVWGVLAIVGPPLAFLVAVAFTPEESIDDLGGVYAVLILGLLIVMGLMLARLPFLGVRRVGDRLAVRTLLRTRIVLPNTAAGRLRWWHVGGWTSRAYRRRRELLLDRAGPR